MIFTTWSDSPEKRCQILFVKKVFQLVKPFLANLHSTIYQKYSLFLHMSIKKRRILRWFQIRGNNWIKVHPEKAVYSGRREKTPILHPFFFNFFVRKFFAFFQQFRNQRKIPYSNFVKKKFLCHISTSLKLKNLTRKKRLKILKESVLQRFFRITFYTHIHVNAYHFLKHHNRCILRDCGTGQDMNSEDNEGIVRTGQVQ